MKLTKPPKPTKLTPEEKMRRARLVSRIKEWEKISENEKKEPCKEARELIDLNLQYLQNLLNNGDKQ